MSKQNNLVISILFSFLLLNFYWIIITRRSTCTRVNSSVYFQELSTAVWTALRGRHLTCEKASPSSSSSFLGFPSACCDHHVDLWWYRLILPTLSFTWWTAMVCTSLCISPLVVSTNFERLVWDRPWGWAHSCCWWVHIATTPFSWGGLRAVPRVGS